MDKNKIHESDILCDYFKDNLEDVQIPVDERCWENISQHLIQKKRRVLLRRSLTVIAATFLLFITVINLNRTDSEKTSESLNKSAIQQSISNNSDKIVVVNKRGNSKPESTLMASLTPDMPKDTSSVDNLAEPVTEEPPKPVRKTAEGKKALYADRSQSEPEFDKKEEKHNDKWVISTLLRTSGSISEGNPQNLQASVIGEEKLTNLYRSPGPSRNSYEKPFSIGLMLSRKMTDELSLETGLVYSYLSTTYTTPHEISQKTLKLHYIGIPVNIVATITEIGPRCKIYMSAGAMVEKGLVSYSTLDNMLDGPMKKKSKIEGIQCSISASAGISYKIFKNWDIYIEPHLSYYFDNNQPLSIRTVQHSISSINSGLRYEF